jgi:plastocyanin
MSIRVLTLALVLGGSAAVAAVSAPDRGAIAGRVTVRQGGQPVDSSGVVLYVVGFNEPPTAETAAIHQNGKRFVPELLPITAGQAVTFPNDDPVFHNVFSPSPVHKFDLGQYPKGDAKTKRFPTVGVVEVYCNIHPQMAATILVLPNRRFVRAEADGSFRLDDVPPGRWTLYAFSRRAAEPVSAAVEITAGRVADVTLALDETRSDFSHQNKFGEKYRDPEKYR